MRLTDRRPSDGSSMVTPTQCGRQFFNSSSLFLHPLSFLTFFSCCCCWFFCAWIMKNYEMRCDGGLCSSWLKFQCEASITMDLSSSEGRLKNEEWRVKTWKQVNNKSNPKSEEDPIVSEWWMLIYTRWGITRGWRLVGNLLGLL